jgi:hypothetical protein
MNPTLEKTDPPVSLAENLWTLDGDWQDTSLRRRMTIIRLNDGSLWLHSPIALPEDQKQWLDRLGPVRWVVAPNRFHCSEVGWYLDRYPEAFAVGSDPALPAIFKQVKRNLLSATQTAHVHWSGEVTCVPIEGTRLMGESAFIHHPSRTLILTDLAFCMDDSQFHSRLEKGLMHLNCVGRGTFGPSWLAENFFFQNDQLVSGSLRKIAEHSFDRIIVNHGNVTLQGGAEVFRSAFRKWL